MLSIFVSQQTVSLMLIQQASLFLIVAVGAATQTAQLSAAACPRTARSLQGAGLGSTTISSGTSIDAIGFVIVTIIIIIIIIIKMIRFVIVIIGISRKKLGYSRPNQKA